MRAIDHVALMLRLDLAAARDAATAIAADALVAAAEVNAFPEDELARRRLAIGAARRVRVRTRQRLARMLWEALRW